MAKCASIFSVILIIVLSGCGRIFNKNGSTVCPSDQMQILRDRLQAVADSCRGELGIAFISDKGDTILINNGNRYPMMSVFKLHQAIATCRYMEQMGISRDSTVVIPRCMMNPDTWSPMLRDNDGDTLRISYRRLLQYALEQSDNNASNYLFETILGTCSVDSTISRIIPRETFKIAYSEAEMQLNHSLAFENYSTPLSATQLINRLYTDSAFLVSESMEFVRRCLGDCKTGADRIPKPLLNKEGVRIAHKTGSGFIDDGVLIAYNDVAFVNLPDERHYALGVFIRNFRGTEKEASTTISRVSDLIYSAMKGEVR